MCYGGVCVGRSFGARAAQSHGRGTTARGGRRAVACHRRSPAGGGVGAAAGAGPLGASGARRGWVGAGGRRVAGRARGGAVGYGRSAVRGVLDTSVFIAGEQGRELAVERLPEEAAISVVTLAELELGVHLAVAEEVRGRRLRSVQAARATYVALPVDEAVASAFAELVAIARRAGHRPKVQDTWIAATARAHGVAVYTQDRHFDQLAGGGVMVERPGGSLRRPVTTKLAERELALLLRDGLFGRLDVEVR